MVKEKKLEVVFIIETKLSYPNIHRIAKTFRFYGCIMVEAVGRSVELMLLWKEEWLIEIVNYS